MMLWCLVCLQILSGVHLKSPGAANFQNASVQVVAWLTEQDHDFGEIRYGKPVTFAFKFKNVSADTILLQTVRTTCGCTAALYTEEPVPPGKEGEVNIEYDAAQSGAFRKKIRVFFDRQRKPEILWIEGEVR